VKFVGEGDLHNPKYNADRVTVDLSDQYKDRDLLHRTKGHCVIYLDVYPSDLFHEDYKSNLPMIFAIVCASVFAIKASLFGLYDLIVQTRNQKVTTVAVRSNAIVSSLFPEAVKERLLAEKERENENLLSDDHMSAEERDENGVFKSKPIADLYPEATVLCKWTRTYKAMHYSFFLSFLLN
jgi:hypothetical protein